MLRDDAVVPEIWPFEIANSIFVSFNRRKRISEQQAREYLELLHLLPVRVEICSLRDNIALESISRKRNIAAYDAAYLRLALRMNVPIATQDALLRDAALAEGVVVIE